MMPILSNFAFPKRIIDIWNREYNGAAPYAIILENHEAGGHNAPPRNRVSFGSQDDLETYFEKVRDLGVRVYVAGDGSTKEEVANWIERGAYGVQIGSRFALCNESGMRKDLREDVIELNAEKTTAVVTSNRLSPTGYPFKHLPMAGTLSEQEVYDNRKRICNKGYLLQSHFATQEDGTTKETYICPAMPEKQYQKLGGTLDDMSERVCLCNALFATAGFGEANEPALVTLGKVGVTVTRKQSAREVIADIFGEDYIVAMERKLSGEVNFARLTPALPFAKRVAAV